MNEDEITAYLKQFTLEQLNEIQLTLEKKVLEKKALEEQERERKALEAQERERKALEAQNKPKRATAGLPPTPPKDISALADAADLDISGLLRDIDRRRR